MGVPVEQRAVFDVDNTGGYWLTVGLFAVELDGTVRFEYELHSRCLSKRTGYVLYAKEGC